MRLYKNSNNTDPTSQYSIDELNCENTYWDEYPSTMSYIFGREEKFDKWYYRRLSIISPLRRFRRDLRIRGRAAVFMYKLALFIERILVITNKIKLRNWKNIDQGPLC